MTLLQGGQTVSAQNMGLLFPARPFYRAIAGEKGVGQGSFKGLCRKMN